VADQWELRYRVLEGKYRSEVPRLAAEIKALKAAQQAEPAATPAAAVDPNAMTPDAVKAQYGDEFANAVDAIAEARTKKLRDELSSRVDGMEAETASRGRSDFMRDLTTLVRNWQVIDQDPGFTAYLDEFDVHTGRQRREFFNEADRNNDAARVASFFSSFVLGKQPAPTPVVAPVAPNADPLISPDSSRHSEAPPGKKLWSTGEIRKFYADAKARQFTPAEFSRIDADISAATVEGRIVG
jgi:hypothetical protein